MEEPHFNVRVSAALKSLGYNYDVSSPTVTAASDEFCREFMTYVYLDENTEQLLRTLRGKYKMGIISNFAIPECIDKLLKNHGLEKMFDAIVVSGAVNKRKPSPEVYEHALQVLGVSASETVFVGDTLDADIEGAKAVGIKAVYIQRRLEKTENVTPDHTIKSLAELPMLLEVFKGNS